MIDHTEIESLKYRAVREGPQIEFKEMLQLNHDGQFELLKDVSAMANSEGGVILYGVTQDDSGAPADMQGLELENVDELHNRIDLIINDNIDERIPGLRHRAVPRPDGKHYYLVQVPASYLAPHMVTMPSKRPRFYSRANTVNAPMTVRQIKDASLVVERAQNRAIDFINERVQWNSRFVGPAYIFNIVPLYSRSYRIDLTNWDIIKALTTLGSGYTIHSVHGLLIKHESQFRREHVLISREGALEKFRKPIAKKSKDDDTPFIPITVLEREIIEFAAAVSKHPQPGLAELPVLLSLTLVRLKGASTWGNDGFPVDQIFDEDNISPEPTLLHDWSDLDTVLKNFFDVIWQSFGMFGSPNYDESGRRRDLA